jgi:hypothetical protein
LLNIFRGTFMPIIRSSRLLYNLKTKHQIRQTATTCITLESSWWWAWKCSKHVEQAISSAIKIHLLHLVGILFPHNIDDARSKPHQIFMERVSPVFRPSFDAILSTHYYYYYYYYYYLPSLFCRVLTNLKRTLSLRYVVLKGSRTFTIYPTRNVISHVECCVLWH